MALNTATEYKQGQPPWLVPCVHLDKRILSFILHHFFFLLPSPQHSHHPNCVLSMAPPPQKPNPPNIPSPQPRFHVSDPASPHLNPCPTVGAFLLSPSLGSWHRHAGQKWRDPQSYGLDTCRPLPSAFPASVPARAAQIRYTRSLNSPRASSPSVA